jgi:hypothetical protein
MQNLPPLRAVELTEAHNSGFRPHQLRILQEPVVGRVTKSIPGLLCIEDSKSSTGEIVISASAGSMLTLT